MDANDIKPGCSFQLRTSSSPEKWETINLHLNCGNELVEYTKVVFMQQPEYFRPVINSLNPFE